MFPTLFFQKAAIVFSLFLTLQLFSDEIIFYDFPTRYTIYDLGDTDFPSDKLSRKASPISYGPRLNQQGHIIWNTLSGGVFWDRCNPKRVFSFRKKPVYFHGLNDKGLVLASVDLESGKNWFLWPSSIWKWQESVVLLPLEIDSSHQYYFSDVNNQSVLIGAKFENGCYKPLFWSPTSLGKTLPYGRLLGVNNTDTLVGLDNFDPEKKPFLWHLKKGWIPFSDDLSSNRPFENVLFLDGVIACDNHVFGSYIGVKNCSYYTWNYQWSPCDNVFLKMDLDGMSISSVNCIHTLVGSVRGEAAVSYKGSFPQKLSEAAQFDNIHLIEATDINDLGEIAAYGLYDEEMHIFLLVPEPSKKSEHETY